MKMKIERSWKLFFRTGYLYRVTAIHQLPDGEITDNKFYDFYRDGNLFFNRNINHLKPEINEWLFNCVDWGKWSSEHPLSRKARGEQNLEDCGILFSRKKDIMRFKLAWA
jgi:hypothetical protein